MQEVKHPSHYGGPEDPYEAIKVIEAWNLGFNLGNVLKYIRRAGRKGAALVDLQKAREYLQFEITKLERPVPTAPCCEEDMPMKEREKITCRGCGMDVTYGAHLCPGPFSKDPKGAR